MQAGGGLGFLIMEEVPEQHVHVTLVTQVWIIGRFSLCVLQISSDIRQANKTISSLVQREALARLATAFCLFSA